MSDAPDKLERDVEASRGRLDRTLADLQARFNQPGIPRDLADLRRSGQAASETVERIAQDVRLNPVPALLIAAGFGLLVYEAFRTAAERRRLTLVPSATAMPDRRLPENHPDPMHARLDDALEESFPGSDPVSVRITK
ncbi:hypothetical protein GOFOIKOB_3678 [Methylobacterium tardum]|uniref:DUF3618 domain-containing protein n=1 Tax=Methylobacterium tardum TaxID=374432 RepID=A0AA37TC78_9HYPH|nr:hypothetical protein [Methylobacterium tardum]URD40249.1 hypothetical protein M6G65_23400 [Methylobacterium tardum]GJE50628.1 hypothetical protein GOFOIKOB_3678 [Methylobacterium tardum]GLS69255.1 hypothetical protein GCM10007890_12670 [Methylobacterium tardum]